MRKLLQVMLALVLLSLLLLPAFGTDAQVWDSVDTGELEDAVEEVLDTELTADIDLDEGLASLGENVLSQLDAVVTRPPGAGRWFWSSPCSAPCSRLWQTGRGWDRGRQFPA